MLTAQIARHRQSGSSPKRLVQLPNHHLERKYPTDPAEALVSQRWQLPVPRLFQPLNPNDITFAMNLPELMPMEKIFLPL
jgi:hypothetical protein